MELLHAWLTDVCKSFLIRVLIRFSDRDFIDLLVALASTYCETIVNVHHVSRLDFLCSAIVYIGIDGGKNLLFFFSFFPPLLQCYVKVCIYLCTV